MSDHEMDTGGVEDKGKPSFTVMKYLDLWSWEKPAVPWIFL
jgi:hypothetical protein